MDQRGWLNAESFVVGFFGFCVDGYLRGLVEWNDEMLRRFVGLFSPFPPTGN